MHNLEKQLKIEQPKKMGGIGPTIHWRRRIKAVSVGETLLRFTAH